MAVHELAGKKAPMSILENIPRLVTSYFSKDPDPENPAERVSFGTSGHRGSSKNCTFNEAHILAISQSVADFRKKNRITGPHYIGMDTHALSEPALVTAIEVMAANGVEIRYQDQFGYTPTPAVSRAILKWNEKGASASADGTVITPSHNPPEDGGFKYNATHGGPAGDDVTREIEQRANHYLSNNLEGVKRVSLNRALQSEHVKPFDFVTPYVEDLDKVINMDAIRNAGVVIGADPMGGSGTAYWEAITEYYDLNLDIVNPAVDPTFRFMTLDRDGKIRMDCSSPFAMAGLIGLKEKYDIAFGNDTDFDRHGIVTKDGLMSPNHYLSVAISYLFRNRMHWGESPAVGKTVVSSSMIDRVAKSLNRELAEVPVGFKWFVEGLLNRSYGFGGEESAGASFLQKDGGVWSTDKDGIILCLLAAEIMAVTGKSPSHHYRDLEEQFGRSVYERMDVPANREEKAVLKSLSPEQVPAKDLAGDPIVRKITNAPANNAPLGGLKVESEHGWFAARPSGTEDVYKIYAESFKGESHLKEIQNQAIAIVDGVLGK